MVNVTFITHDGEENSVDIPEGWTVMQGGLRHGIDGIEAECGGSCACATCHCYVDDADMERVGGPSENEDKMLEHVVSERLPNSRLSCQIKLTPALDGLVVRLPEAQS